MYINHVISILGVLTFPFVANASNSCDSTATIKLNEVNVVESYNHLQSKRATLHTDVLNADYLKANFTGNLVQSISNTPGVQSMDIGMGFSKPMIRGLGFNRVAVAEGGIKQEGQQWGADHGLEVDAFSVNEVKIVKGPSSLQYGSDAMGGTITLGNPAMPSTNQIFGDFSLLGKSVNTTLGASLMLGIKKEKFGLQLRYSEQHFGDYHVPADTAVYLTIKMPLYGRKLKNTAGYERDIKCFGEYHDGRYSSNYNFSNVYQKVGFFPGAHGVPSIDRVKDDGNSWNIELPYSLVNHLKAMTHQQYQASPNLRFATDIGFQHNHREEWSSFHTHYSAQPMPSVDPDKELQFDLSTVSGRFFAKRYNENLEHTWGVDFEYQNNEVAGYSFLLPDYNRITAGAYYIGTYSPSYTLDFTYGVRYDWRRINIQGYYDPYIVTHLEQQGYDESVATSYGQRCNELHKNFGNYSASIGMSWNPLPEHSTKLNIGRCYRIPTPNELASNGEHHGTFRHEQGDPTLKAEQGWQLDASYQYTNSIVHCSVSPFASYYDHYIFLKPTGTWSLLPHTGQLYKYTNAKVIMAGGEFLVDVNITRNLLYTISGEYVYTRNVDDKTALSFSPPTTIRNHVEWKQPRWTAYIETQSIFSQNAVAHNEETTPGATLLHLGGSLNFKLSKQPINISLMARNILNTCYYNHLSFYRKIELPEAGRNFQLLINIPFIIKTL